MKMKFRKMASVIACAFLVLLVMSMLTPVATFAARTADQVLVSLKMISNGVSANGVNVLQVGEVNTLSAGIATATLTETVAAPATASVYLRGVFVEKSTGAAGTYTVKYGTGVNCVTGTTTVLGPVTNPTIGFNRIEVIIPATKAVCVQTDAATTLVRTLTN